MYQLILFILASLPKITSNVFNHITPMPRLASVAATGAFDLLSNPSSVLFVEF